MGEVLSFPSLEDRKVMESAVSMFLTSQNGKLRNIMVGVLRQILERYSLEKMSFTKYIIYRGTQGGVAIIPRQILKDGVQECPVCGSNIYDREPVTILTITEGPAGDLYTYGCKCQAVFGKWETA